MSKHWKAEDTIVAKGSKAKVITSDSSDGQNWVTVLYGGQEYQGYQAEFEAKGWKKPELQITLILGWFFGLLFALMGLSLLGLAPFSGLLFLLMSAFLLPPVNKLIRDRFGFSVSGKIKAAVLVVTFFFAVITVPPAEKTQISSSSPSPSPVEPVETVVQSPVQRIVQPSPRPSPVQRVVQPSPKPSPVQRAVEPSPLPSQTLTPSLEKDTPLRSAASGSCDCPYDTDKRGRACGARSAYNRPSGKRPKCYVGD